MDVAGQVRARCDQLGLDERLEGRARSGPAGQHVVVGVVRAVVVRDRPDRDDVGQVARYADGHGVGPVVAGRGHDHDPGTPGCHDGLVQRIVPVVGLRIGGEREVQYADVEFFLVGHDEIERPDHVQVSAAAVCAEGLDRDHARSRRDPDVVALVGVAVDRDAGQV